MLLLFASTRRNSFLQPSVAASVGDPICSRTSLTAVYGRASPHARDEEAFVGLAACRGGRWYWQSEDPNVGVLGDYESSLAGCVGISCLENRGRIVESKQKKNWKTREKNHEATMVCVLSMALRNTNQEQRMIGMKGPAPGRDSLKGGCGCLLYTSPSPRD